MITPPLTGGVGRPPAHGVSGVAQEIEAADEVDLDHPGEAGERRRPLLAQHFLRDADAGTVDQPLEATETGQRIVHAGLAVGVHRDIGGPESHARTQRRSQGLPSLDVAVGDQDVGALGLKQANRGLAKAGCAAGDDER